jgi:2-iminobutanoate/2-iminopropanoate deaminase
MSVKQAIKVLHINAKAFSKFSCISMVSRLKFSVKEFITLEITSSDTPIALELCGITSFNRNHYLGEVSGYTRTNRQCQFDNSKYFELDDSSMKNIVDVEGLPKGGPYSHSVSFQNLIFVSGQTGHVDGRKTAFSEQFTNAIEKVSKILQANGSSLNNVLKVTVYLSKPEYFQEMNELFKKYFNTQPPARTTIVCGFASPEILVEIDVIAFK